MDVYYIEIPIHKNNIRLAGIDLDAEENAGILANLVLSVEGGVIGVKKDAVMEHLKDPEVRKVRIGNVKFPKKFKIENEKDLFRLLAMLVSLEDY